MMFKIKIHEATYFNIMNLSAKNHHKGHVKNMKMGSELIIVGAVKCG